MRIEIILVLLVNLVELCHGGNKKSKPLTVDSNGYLFFCLCMGRFGNQMEHFLGSLAFAKQVDRIFVIPQMRTYVNVPFSDWFKVKPLREYHRVITADKFMKNLAPVVWPKDRRFGFCLQMSDAQPLCEVKKGNPFTAYWDELNVDFTDTVRHAVTFQTPRQWVEVHKDYPVVAMKGAPATFPIQEKHEYLQQFIHFSDKIIEEGNQLLKTHFGNDAKDYVAIHLRNGGDWERACSGLTDDSSNFHFMASYQCHRYDTTKIVGQQQCLPDFDVVLTQAARLMKRVKARKLLIATDKSAHLTEFRERLGSRVAVVHIDPWLPVVDAFLLSHSAHFIGNCVSSFSSFVARHRKYHNLGPTEYFAWDTDDRMKNEL